MGKRHYRRYLSPDLVEELKQIRESERAEISEKYKDKTFEEILEMFPFGFNKDQ